MRSACLLLLLAGCSRCGETKLEERPLVLGTLYEPSTLDPAFASTVGEREIVELIHRDLTAIDERGATVPSLAELPEVTTTSSGERVRWRLREGYGWSDGTPITSADVMRGFTIQRDDRLEAMNHFVAAKIGRLQIEGPRAFTVLWTEPMIDRDSPRVHPLLPAHVYPQPTDSTFAGMVKGEVSSGPYRVKEWVPGQYLALERNRSWGGAKPELERIVFRFCQAEDAMLAALRAGEIDALGEASGLTLDASDVIAERMKETHAVHLKRSGAWFHLAVRLDHPLLKQPRVRRAISQAIDREALAKVLYGGHAQPAFGLFPEGHPGHRDANGLGHDPASALQLMEGAKTKVELMYAGGAAGARAAEFVAVSLGKIGIEVEPIGVHARVLSDKLTEREHPPLALYLLRAVPTSDGQSVVHSEGTHNFSSFRDPMVDALISDTERSVDRAEWSRRVLQVNLHFQEALPAIPLLFRDVASVRPLWLDGWTPTGHRTPVTWNAEVWRKTRSGN